MGTQIFLNGITIEELAKAIAPLLQSEKVEQLDNSYNFITRDEVCNLLSINKTTLWKHTKSKKLKSYGIGNRVYYKKDEVLQAVKPINS